MTVAARHAVTQAPPTGRLLTRHRAERSVLTAMDVAMLVVGVLVGSRLTSNTIGVVTVTGVVLAVDRPMPLRPALLDELPSIVARLLVAFGLLALVRQMLSGGVGVAHRLELLALMTVLVAIGRASAYRQMKRRRRCPQSRRRTLVVGAGEIGGQLVGALQSDHRYGLEPVAFLDPDPRRPAAGSLPVFRDLDLGRVIDDSEVDVVIVAFCAQREHLMVDILRACHRRHVEIYIVPRFFEIFSVAASHAEDVHGIPLVHLSRNAHRCFSWRLKRVMDIVVAGAGLVIAAPVLAVAAIALHRETGGSVLFRQRRVGIDSKPFTILKLQTLRPTTEAESATLWSIADSNRLGPVGRFLRKSSIDELPQLWNVLRGDMSLVGPRPERPHFVEQFSERYPHYRYRHRVPCGLTGLAQINGLRGDTPIDQRARLDNVYIEQWSLWGDAKILMRTMSSVIFNTGS